MQEIFEQDPDFYYKKINAEYLRCLELIEEIKENQKEEEINV